MNSPHPTWYNSFFRVFRALTELLAHLLLVTGLLAGIRLMEAVVHWLWGTTDYLFFRTLRLRFIFDAADLTILVGFLLYGIYSVLTTYVRGPR